MDFPHLQITEGHSNISVVKWSLLDKQQKIKILDTCINLSTPTDKSHKYLAGNRFAWITAFRRFLLLWRVSGSWMELFWTIPPYKTSPVQSGLMASKHGQTASNRPTDFQCYSRLGTWMAIPERCPWSSARIPEQFLSSVCASVSCWPIQPPVRLQFCDRFLNLVLKNLLMLSGSLPALGHSPTVRWDLHQILPRVRMSILWIAALSRCHARCPQMCLFKRLWKCFIRITVPYSFFLCVVKQYTVTPSAVRWL